MTTADWIKRRRELLGTDPGMVEALRAGAAAHTRHTGVERGSDDLVICSGCGWAYVPGFALDEGDSRVHEHKATVAIDAALPHLFADARTSLPLALDALEAVLARHQPIEHGPNTGWVGEPWDECRTCLGEWPCATVDAIETALAGGCRECRQTDGHHKLDCGRRTT